MTTPKTPIDDSAPPPRDDLGARLRKARARASLFRKPLELVKIERFILLDQIGAGSMGEVYAAYDERLDRKVAIKLVRRGAVSESQADQRLLREAQILARLSHPNVVQIYDAGMYEGRVFIAMEFIRGQTMSQWLESTASQPRQQRNRDILRHFAAAGRGLEAVHKAGLTHRDFKPGNVMVGDDGRVRVVDFGLARAAGPDEIGADEQALAAAGALSETAPLLTPRDAMIGTPAYMAPELFTGQSADSRSDQFSFCVALYEALYDERPFQGHSRDEIESGLTSSGVFRRGRGREVPALVRRALRRGLSPDPDARFADMGKLVDELESWPRRRRVWVAALAVVALVAGLYGYAQSRSAAVCQGANRELAGVWNGERRGALEQAILGTGLGYAQEVWPLVAGGIDEYARGWRRMHRDACMAHREGRQSAVMLDKRMACLDRRRTALASAVAVLAETTPESLRNSADVVQNLPGLDDCGNIEALAAEVPPPENAAVAERVDALRRRLSHANALEGAGRYGDARAIAEDVVAEAETLGYEPLLAEALLSTGRIIMSMGAVAYQESIEPLERAAKLSLRVGMNAAAIEAFARFIYARAASTSDSADMLAFAPMMEALSARLAEGVFARALLLNNIGAVYLARRDRERARQYFARAVAVQKQEPSAGTIEIINATQNLAMVTADAQTRAALMGEVLRTYERTLGVSHPKTLDLRIHASSFIADPRQAHDMLAPACEKYQRYFPEAEYAQVRCAYKLGFMAAELGNEERGAAHLSSVVATARDASQHSVIRALAAGYARLYSGDPAAALPWFATALDELAGAAPESWWLQKRIAYGKLGVGVSEQALGRHGRAVVALEEAMTLFEQLTEHHYNTENRKRLAWTRMALAMSLWAEADKSGGREAVRERVDLLMAQAEAWYRAHDGGYEWRLQEIARWRQGSEL